MQDTIPYYPQPIDGDQRDARLRERDRLIAIRWWWLSDHLKLRSSYALEVLSSREFFLQDRYIMYIIERQGDVLRAMREHRPSAKEMAKLYPSFVWTSGASI